jgi:hypothetical protein
LIHGQRGLGHFGDNQPRLDIKNLHSGLRQSRGKQFFATIAAPAFDTQYSPRLMEAAEAFEEETTIRL